MWQFEMGPQFKRYIDISREPEPLAVIAGIEKTALAALNAGLVSNQRFFNSHWHFLSGNYRVVCHLNHSSQIATVVDIERLGQDAFPPAAIFE